LIFSSITPQLSWCFAESGVAVEVSRTLKTIQAFPMRASQSLGAVANLQQSTALDFRHVIGAKPFKNVARASNIVTFAHSDK
jgi:hypothetical protein